MCAAGARKCRNPLERGSGSARELSAKTRRRGRDRMSRHQDRKYRSVKERASERNGKARRRIDVKARSHCHDLRGLDLRVHRAVMRTVPAAARWQARVSAVVDEGRQRPEPEEQDEENGEAAPHLKFMLADTERDPAAGDKNLTMIHSPLKETRAGHSPPTPDL